MTTLKFLRDMDKEQQQDGMLLKTLADGSIMRNRQVCARNKPIATCSTLSQCSITDAFDLLPFGAGYLPCANLLLLLRFNKSDLAPND